MENNQEPVTQTAENIEGTTVTQTETKTEEKTEKTFTQADMNKLEMKIENKFKEKYKGYDEWLESQKTEAEKSKEKDNEIERLTKENMSLKNANFIANSNVDSKFQKFVLSEVSELEGDFEDNLKDYLKNNPQYLIQKENEGQNQSTGIPQTNSNANTVSDEKAYLDKKYANNPYYKK